MMTDERVKASWSHTSSVMALLANCHRDSKKGKAFGPKDFDPYAKHEPIQKVDVGVLKAVFIDGKLPKSESPERQRVDQPSHVATRRSQER